MKLFCLTLVVCMIHSSLGHSWLACSDYAEKNGADWDPTKCRGFPRDAARYAPKNKFGIDTGFDYRPAGGSQGCKTRYSDSSYSAAYPKAVYFQGQQVILAHPMKNHGADPACTNRYIPDNGNAIYRGNKDTDRDKTFSYYKQTLVANLGVSKFGNQAGDLVSVYPKPGFQNAPNFCKDTDKSMGTYSFNVPTNIQPGEYTFLWRWSFNSKNDVYATCFDVIITRTKAQRDNMLRQRGQSLYVACGGTLSDGTPSGSTIGCDGVPQPPPLPSRPTSRPGVPTRRPRPRPTTRPTKAPRPNSRQMTVKITQVVGEVELGAASSQISKRYVDLDFGCSAKAIMWNGRLYEKNKNGKDYKILQDKDTDIGEGSLPFMASYDKPCNFMRYPPNSRFIERA